MDSKIDHTTVSSKTSLWEQLETIWKLITTETVEKYKQYQQKEQAVVVNLVLLKCRRLRREDQEKSDSIVSRILY